jgi:hypothetical protein
MEMNLHANATTTPKTRAYIQRSKKSVATGRAHRTELRTRGALWHVAGIEMNSA